ncbi:hypothetical protein SCAR479_06201 [Seiridium cardinale]|uniref:Uncharacterized protein n=1 Tax=Seiridium cardinale TaxID=138064 RepID=A0ABR2XTL2_9PEZI
MTKPSTIARNMTPSLCLNIPRTRDFDEYEPIEEDSDSDCDEDEVDGLNLSDDEVSARVEDPRAVDIDSASAPPPSYTRQVEDLTVMIPEGLGAARLGVITMAFGPLLLPVLQNECLDAEAAL